MSVDAVTPISANQPWYKSLTRQQWNVLAASNLGWLFDGFENYALILTAGPALRQLLDPSLDGQLPFYIGATIGINLLGWGIGGMLGGIAAGYFGLDRRFCPFVKLDLLRDGALLGRRCRGLRMGDG